jgi:tight adherence protein B
MLGLDINVVAMIALVAVAAGALCYAFLFSRMEVEKKADARLSRVKMAEGDLDRMKSARDRVQELSKRRKSVQDSLKELEKSRRKRTRRSAIAASSRAWRRPACP